jgi:hypothetical protein
MLPAANANTRLDSSAYHTTLRFTLDRFTASTLSFCTKLHRSSLKSIDTVPDGHAQATAEVQDHSDLTTLVRLHDFLTIPTPFLPSPKRNSAMRNGRNLDSLDGLQFDAVW